MSALSWQSAEGVGCGVRMGAQKRQRLNALPLRWYVSAAHGLRSLAASRQRPQTFAHYNWT